MDRPGVAVELIDRYLSLGGRPDYVEGPVLAASVQAHLSLGEIGAATRCLDRLAALAIAQSTPALRGFAAVASAQLCVATSSDDPRSCWHEAISYFASAKMPLERATARLELARLSADDRPEVAVAEASVAFRDLTELGALRAADQAAALLRSLGAPARPGPKRNAGLTKREQEVLDLVGHASPTPRSVLVCSSARRPWSTT